jgi:hypothetical protein
MLSYGQIGLGVQFFCQTADDPKTPVAITPVYSYDSIHGKLDIMRVAIQMFRILQAQVGHSHPM